MDLLLVRHGESVGNLEGRMQGHRDYPLSETGRAQARTLAAWLRRRNVEWDAAYSSPLARARETAEILAAETGGPAAVLEPGLAEIRAGKLEGLTRDDMAARHPTFLQRRITDLGDFDEFGGESYDAVQARARDLLHRLEQEHRAAESRLLLVGHGGINFQLIKMLICEPVPRICILRMENCTVTRVRMRERRGSYLGEVVWHVPLELMQLDAPEAPGEGSAGAIFR